MSHQHSSHHPPTSLRPTGIPNRPDFNGTIYIETSTATSSTRAMPPPSDIPSRPGPSISPQQSQSSSSSLPVSQYPNLNDVAGVLRRNQACLNCRRRKLKCDAVRPNCGTCVRSHKHHMRISPDTTGPLCCEYDDGTGGANLGPGQTGEGLSPVVDAPEEDGEASKKKKKRTGDNKRKSRKDEEDEETEKLRKKIEALEAQLANTQQAGPSRSTPPTAPQISPQDQNQSWSNPSSAFSSTNISAPSPTAFLEMLSSAATAQASNIGEGASVPGMRVGAAENAMMSSTWAATPTDMNNTSTGLTPFLSFIDNQEAQPASEARILPDRHDSGNTESMDPDSRRSSTGGPQAGANGNNIPTSWQFAAGTANANGHETVNLNWPPLGQDGLQPSTRTEGPWRGVETVSSVYGQQQPANGFVMQDTAPQLPEQSSSEMNEAIQQQLLLDLFWPGWPQYLPEPNIVNDLVESFYELVPNMPRVLHRARFLARLALPPTHSNFPHPALIHAICASAASWCAPAVYERSTRARWTDAPWANDKNMTFALRQAAFGKDAVQDGLNTGNRLFDVVRAMIILSRVFIDDTRMLECWAYSGLVTRMMLPLGLNVRSAELSLKSVMLPPPADALEREERRITVWMAFYHDTVASAASGWGTSMSIDELTVPLTVSAKDFEEGNESMLPNPQDLDSGDFWTRHPVADPFVMVTKACVLLNRVNRFVRKWKNRHLREDDDFDGMQRPEFRELANAAACLQMSFPPMLRNPAKLNNKKRLDIDLIAAHMIPHAAIICLYEAFADISDPNDGPARRILGAAQSIVSIVQQLAMVANDGASNLSNVMHSSASVCLVTAARTSLLFYRLALNHQDQQTAESHRMDIEMIRTSLQAFGQRFKIGHHHSQLIEYFLDRASRPDYQKLQAHYPTHPRPGAPELHPAADFGQCILNALNIKRGFWRKWSDIAGNVGASPFGSTPESAAYASSAAGHGGSATSTTGTGSATDRSANITRISSDSPHGFGNTNVNGQTNGNGISFGNGEGGSSLDFCPMKPINSTGSITNINSNENSPSQWTNFFAATPEGLRQNSDISNGNGMNGGTPPLHPPGKTAPIPYPQGMFATTGLPSSAAYTSNTPSNIFEWYNVDAATRPNGGGQRMAEPNREGASGGGLTKEMEALFDSVNTVEDGQRTGISMMKPNGAMWGINVPLQGQQ